MSDRIDKSNGRRGFLRKLLGLVVAPAVVPAVLPAPVYQVGVDLARDHAVDAVRYVMAVNPLTGRFEMFGYTVQGGESIRVETIAKPGGTSLT